MKKGYSVAGLPSGITNDTKWGFRLGIDKTGRCISFSITSEVTLVT